MNDQQRKHLGEVMKASWARRKAAAAAGTERIIARLGDAHPGQDTESVRDALIKVWTDHDGYNHVEVAIAKLPAREFDAIGISPVIGTTVQWKTLQAGNTTITFFLDKDEGRGSSA